MLGCLHGRRIALFLGLVLALTAGEARAADTGNGSKNFNPPRSVPNYFSNEAGPMLGPASETQRGPLYAGQNTQPQTQMARAPVARGRQHIAMAEPRGRLIRAHGRVVAHHVIVHGRVVTRIAVRGSARSYTHAHYAAVRRASYTAHRTSHAATGHATRVSSSRRRAHG